MLKVNLLPWRQHKQRKRTKQTLFLFVLCNIALLSYTLYVTIQMTKQNNQLERRNRLQEQQIQSLSHNKNATIPSTEKREYWHEMATELQKQLEQQQLILQLLQLLEETLPYGIWLDKLSVHLSQLILSGHTLDYEALITLTERLNKETSYQLTLKKFEKAQCTLYSSCFSFSLEGYYE